MWSCAGDFVTDYNYLASNPNFCVELLELTMAYVEWYSYDGFTRTN